MKHSRDFSQFDGILANGVNHAVIDVDNTITKSNIAQFYLFIKRERLNNRLLWWLFTVWLRLHSILQWIVCREIGLITYLCKESSGSTPMNSWRNTPKGILKKSSGSNSSFLCTISSFI